MKHITCINQALEAGAIDQQMADEILSDIQAYAQQLRRTGEVQAESLAAEMALQKMAEIKQRAKHHKALSILTNQRNLAAVQSHSKSMEAGIMSLLTKDLKVHQGRTPWANVDYRSKSIEGVAHGKFTKGLEALHTTRFGLKQDRVTVKATVKELFGESSQNPKAKEAAKGFSEAAEYLRERFNRAGGYIPKRDDWGLPQSHNSSRVAKASEDEWVGYVKPMLNREKMTDDAGVPLTDKAFDEGVRQAYWTIVNRGMSAQKAGTFKGNRLGNKHMESRFLVFNNADNWVKYQERFGEPDIFSTMTGHIRNMSHEVAMLEVLGPNPKQAFNYLKDMAGLEGKKSVGLLDATYKVVSGEADAIAEGTMHNAVAQTLGTVRHGLVAAQLGSAAISAISDPVFAKMTHAYNGIPAVKMAQQILKQLNPASDADRAWAAHMGLVADAWTHRATASARFAGEVDPNAVGQKASEAVIRASGLAQWTQAHRNAFGLDFQWHLANQVDKPLAKVEDKFQAMLRRYGVTDEIWEVARKAPLEERNGTRYFRPENIQQIEGIQPRMADEYSAKILDAINTEMDFANPMPDARVRAIMTFGGHQRGTAAGEISRLTMMYKGFAISVLTTHIMRGITRGWNGKFDLMYMPKLLVGLTIMGGLAIQLKDISKGKEPRDMNNPEFLIAAMMQGGGTGILGDFIYSGVSGQSRHGHNILTTLAGPGGGLLVDTVELGLSNTGELLSGEETNFGRELGNYMKRYAPGSSLWYTRLITERMIFDEFQEWADPKAKANWRRLESRYKKEHGAKYWWSHKDTVPQF